MAFHFYRNKLFTIKRKGNLFRMEKDCYRIYECPATPGHATIRHTLTIGCATLVQAMHHLELI